MDLDQPPYSTGAAEDAEQTEKPLGRGLEQISHLFLSHRTNASSIGDIPTVRLPEPAPPAEPASPAARVTLLQPSVSVSKDRVVAVLKDNPGALEEGLRVIDIFVPCHPHSDIHLLALNRANQLTAIDLETSLNDALVLRGFAHLDWLKHNLPNIRRMYPQQSIALSSQPRLFLIAPRFSALALNAARQLTQMQIHCVRYQAFDIGGGLGISFEPISWE
jgi:hypothetical protein